MAIKDIKLKPLDPLTSMDKGERPNIKGIRITRMQVAIITISCILSALLTATAYIVLETLHDTYTAINDFAVCVLTENRFISASDYLTEQVRLYTVTGSQEYMDNYFTEALETRRRETALEDLSRYDLEPAATEYLQSALDHSNELMEREIYAIRLTAVAQGQNINAFPQLVQDVILTEGDGKLTPEQMMEKARELVFGATYQTARNQIRSDMEYSLNSLDSMTKAAAENSYDKFSGAMSMHRILIGIHFAAMLAGFIFTILLVVVPMVRYAKNIQNGTTMQVAGAYECKCLAHTYNLMYAQNAAHAHQLRHQAEHDALTGLLNRGAFDAHEQSLHNSGKPLGLLIVDVDKFKQVNDGYGHEMGDKVLQRVASLLTENFQDIGQPFRIGGDEFSVILTDVLPEQETQVLEKIEAINQTLTHPVDGLPEVSLSVGGAFSDHGFSTGLYKRADLALYEVKEHGRRGARFYRKEMR